MLATRANSLSKQSRTKKLEMWHNLPNAGFVLPSGDFTSAQGNLALESWEVIGNFALESWEVIGNFAIESWE